MELNGKTAIVTGSGTGIGRALALEFARCGANVVCCARREDKVQETARLIEEAGGNALAMSVDVTDLAQVQNMAAQTLGRFGSIDVLFNNAGSFNALGALWEVAPDVWWHDVEVNLKGPMLCSKAVLPSMMERGEGIIINMNGGGALSCLMGGSGYGSSKAAVLRLTETLARELSAVGSSVMVFAVGPGFVRTEMTELQVTTDGGRKWLPGSGKALDEGADCSPEVCAKFTMKLICNARPELNGRIFDVSMDLDDILKRAPEIQENDLYTMRFRL